MKLSHRLLLPLALQVGIPAFADTVSGSIVNHNDVARIPITISASTDLTIWSDSAASGGFDPILTLWSGDTLVAYNDDTPGLVDPAQSYIDSLLQFRDLTPGNYLLTVTSFSNFSKSSSLADGFSYDGAAPVPIGEWWNRGHGTYSVHWTHAYLPFVSVVPEPSTFAMLVAGLGIAGIAARRGRGKFA